MAKSILRWFLMTRIVLCLATNFNVLSFDYIQQFKKPVELGKCAYRYVTLRGKQQVFHQDCAFYEMGTSKFEASNTNDSFIVSLNEENLLTHINLCDGDAASYMGLLYEGECLAVEIGNMITFNQSTYIRAFVENYRTGIDELTVDWSPFEGFTHYYKQVYYLQKRSYGTYELIIAQMTFENNNQRNAAQNLVLTPPLLSDQMEVINEAVGTPQHIRLIRVSTAEYIKKFKDYNAENFPEVLYQIRSYENDVRRMRKMVKEDKSKHHLEYEFHPFANAVPEKSLTTRSRRLWENVTQMEIQTGKAISEAEHATERCKRKKKKLRFCQKIEKIAKGLKRLHRQLHNVRSRWYYLNSTKLVNVTSNRSLRYDHLMKAFENILHTCDNSKPHKKRRKHRRKSISSENPK
ncbi:uncharacterized protein LOC115209345 isoform X1 [Octopus sinensis]|uniref:Uncharacterized protein LOC115209345 isoform X1 n=2 Tax=Octopus sinensis TaxID=2607531 RepID=A0A6P7S5U8_9MOLL|nr:uncharacterized protein LOC115209345 isoform X1 [Octopus sinensis]